MGYTNPGRLFIEKHGAIANVDDVLCYATFLREEANLSTDPPIDVERIYARFGIPRPKRAPLPGLQGLALNPEKGLIMINSNDPPLRQRFSEGHELMELLFSSMPKGKGWAARQKAGPFRLPAKERLCNEGAAELLMPRVSFVPRVCAAGVSYETARSLAPQYAVSVSAALVHMARVGPGRHAVVLWRMKNKPSEIHTKVPAEQLPLFGEPSSAMPVKRLRVEWSLAQPEDVFIPSHKSVPEDSSVYRAWKDGILTIGRDLLDLGSTTGVFTCENWPFELEGERYVLSLMHLPGDAGCGPELGPGTA